MGAINCQELHQEIQALKEHTTAMQEKADHLVQQGGTNIEANEFLNQLQQSSEQTDNLLNKYMDVFVEQHPEIFRDYDDKFGENISTFTSDMGATVLLPDGNVFAFGHNGESGILSQQDEHSYSFSKKNLKFNYHTETAILLPNGDIFIGGGDSGHGEAHILFRTPQHNYALRGKISDIENEICTSTSLPDGNIFVGGYKAAYILSQKNNTAYNLSKNIGGFDSFIATATPFPNGDVFVGGGNFEHGEARILSKNSDDTYKFSDKISEINHEICASASFPDGDIFIGGYKAAYVLSQGRNNTYELSDKIPGFDNDLITNAITLPSGEILVGGRNGETRILSKNSDGTYKFSEKITGFNNCIRTAVVLPNGDMFVGGGDYNNGHSEAHILSRNDIPESARLDHLKNNLDKILKR